MKKSKRVYRRGDPNTAFDVAGGRDIALRCPRPRSRAGGTCVERGSIPLVAPLHAALDAAAQRPYQKQCQEAPFNGDAVISTLTVTGHFDKLWNGPQR